MDERGVELERPPHVHVTGDGVGLAPVDQQLHALHALLPAMPMVPALPDGPLADMGVGREEIVEAARSQLAKAVDGFDVKPSHCHLEEGRANEVIPRTARRETEAGGLDEVAADELAVGDVVQVRPGDRVPCDGEIVEGRSSLDESPVTGESVPVSRGPGEPVLAGSINADGVLRLMTRLRTPPPPPRPKIMALGPFRTSTRSTL